MVVKECSSSNNDDVKSFKEYGKKIVKLQEEYLIPLKEDLSDWINRVLGIDDINADNFIQKLESGVIVCKLAKLIEERCLLNPELGGYYDHLHSRHLSLTPQVLVSLNKVDELGKNYQKNAPNAKNLERRSSICGYNLNENSNLNCISARKMKCWENAKPESFYARDNVSNFLKWCRKIQVREAVLFESEDLVLHHNPRSVVLCLLEVAQIVCKKFFFSPAPVLVQFEKEIDAQERADLEQKFAKARKTQCKKCNIVDKEEKLNLEAEINNSEIIISNTDVFDGQCSSNDLNRTSSIASISTLSNDSAITTDITQNVSNKNISQLDQKVMMIAKSYYGKKAKHGIERLAEGKYRIAGKIVFVRLLKDRHVMVRVGGGWDTLQHFLERHGNDSVKEISPSDLLPMDTRPSESTSRRRDSQSSLQSVPSTPVLRRCLSSTPVSGSSLSSPEPWMSGSSNSSGYGSGQATNDQTTNSQAKIDSKVNKQTNKTLNKTFIRRASNLETIRDRSISESKSNSFYGFNRGRSSFTSNRPLYFNLNKASTTSNINLYSTTNTKNKDIVKQNRYPNYLQSSQHITSKTTNLNATSPTKVNVSKVNRASLRAF